MVSPVVKLLSHLAILSSVLGHVSAEQRENQGNFFKFAQPYLSDNSTTSQAAYQCTPYDENHSGLHLYLRIDLNKLVGNDNGTLVCGRQAFKGTMLSQEQVSWSEDGIEISQGQ
ncbi:hypothetical protein CGCVW01_v013752 [Colletotrichum viniferum]|nr:hypothetical protein CGCVW01_v013752 [Colletotrichum viniferum]